MLRRQLVKPDCLNCVQVGSCSSCGFTIKTAVDLLQKSVYALLFLVLFASKQEHHTAVRALCLATACNEYSCYACKGSCYNVRTIS